MSMLTAFVYRRYTDFSVTSAREMKTLMRAEVARLGMDADLKRGTAFGRWSSLPRACNLSMAGDALSFVTGHYSIRSRRSSAEVLPSGEANRLATITFYCAVSNMRSRQCKTSKLRPYRHTILPGRWLLYPDTSTGTRWTRTCRSAARGGGTLQ